MISTFSKSNNFLSNLRPLEVPILHAGISYPTVEHFYQAMKSSDTPVRKELAASLTAVNVTREGRKVSLRPNWEEKKEQVMLSALRWKFSKKNPELRHRLLCTGTQYLQEGNYWKDKYWGVYMTDGEGQNRLGHLLMQVRDEIIQQVPMRIIVAGGRKFKDQKVICDGINALIEDVSDDEILFISGMAQGVDILSHNVAQAAGFPVLEYPADWQDMSEPCVVKVNAHGKYNALAGHKRNGQMRDIGTHLLAFWDGKSSGTKDMIDKATAAGLNVTIVGY